MEKPGSENGREAPVEQLWERSREERKETNSRAKYRNLEGRHGKLGRRERGNRGSESGDGHRESNCEAEPGREGKEEQRLSSQNPKLRRTKECQNRGGQKVDRKRCKPRNGRPREVRSESGKTKVNRKEAAAGIESGGRRKEIADDTKVLTEKSRPFLMLCEMKTF